MFPDALFAEVEPVAQPVELPFEPPPPVTIVLRQEDAAYLHPDQSLGVLPRTNRSWADVRLLMAAASAALHARGVDEVEQRVLDLVLDAFPAGLAVLRRSRNGVVSSASSVRAGHSSQLSAKAQEIASRSVEEQVSLLYLGDTTSMAAPLIAHGEPVGAIVVDGAPAGPRLDKHHLQLLTGVAALAAPALALQLRLRG